MNSNRIYHALTLLLKLTANREVTNLVCNTFPFLTLEKLFIILFWHQIPGYNRYEIGCRMNMMVFQELTFFQMSISYVAFAVIYLSSQRDDSK